MITLIEALNFRCLRYVRQPLKPFHILVGPNASGKSTFLDVVTFLGHLVSSGLDAAVEKRSENFHDLVWGRKAARFELAIEASIPDEHQPPLDSPDYDLIRYELALGINEETDKVSLLNEQILLGRSDEVESKRDRGVGGEPPGTLFLERADARWKPLIRRFRRNELHVAPEQYVNERGEPTQGEYDIAARPKTNEPIFVQLPEDHFPASMWLSESLARGARRIELDSRKLRKPSAPGKGVFPSRDGSNLPWVVNDVKRRAPQQFGDWIAHLRTALPDLKDLRVVDRPEDKHRYLMLCYEDGLEVPSWMASDGTLRLLALTLLAYVQKPEALWLVEEPENSLHPLNIETVVQSLQSVYDGQVLVATHSSILLAMVKPESILVFSRDERRGTTITPGDQHPALKEWRGEVSLGTLFAGGVLG
ncbi:MAG: AAA family ATPase [Phycisphaerae bacterium]|nr:AAA family ATPase [Phycisphaerae bacterium]